MLTHASVAANVIISVLTLLKCLPVHSVEVSLCVYTSLNERGSTLIHSRDSRSRNAVFLSRLDMSSLLMLNDERPLLSLTFFYGLISQGGGRRYG